MAKAEERAARDAEIVRLYSEDYLCVGQIEERQKCSRSTIYRALKHYPWSAEAEAKRELNRELWIARRIMGGVVDDYKRFDVDTIAKRHSTTPRVIRAVITLAIQAGLIAAYVREGADAVA